MVPVTSLLIPIAVSSVLVFIVSSIIHMVLPYHRNDFSRLASEDDVMDALRRFKIPPGDYLMPAPGGAQAMSSPEFVAKRDKGPVAVMTVIKPGPPSLGPQLALWFVYSLAVGLFAAYVTGVALPSGAPYRAVFRIAGTVAFAGYALALPQTSIWYGRSWSATLKSMFDGLIYALLTAGTLGWLWPR
ncbi:MAG TPA: hypothetical protein VM846_18120 [Vicinamibacterales bacterium]|nr:hypothetical protein [Vicinamibacterales bacterium]